MLSNKRKKPRLKFIPGLALILLAFEQLGRGVLPLGVLIFRGLTARRFYIQGSYSQEVLHPGVFQAGGLTSRGLTAGRSYM